MSVESCQFTVEVHHDDGCLWAEVEEHEGCFATGDDMDDLMSNLAEALGLYMSTPTRRVYVTIKSWEVVGSETDDHFRILVDA